MDTQITGVAATYLLTILLAIPLGKYIAQVYAGKPSVLDFLHPLEKAFFKLSGIDAGQQMNWKESMAALLSINLVWFVWAMILLLTQSWHPFWNPDNIPSMPPDLAFNTAISFLVNCNLQHYSGETGLSYLSQLGVICFLQFVTAGTGMAALAVVFNALKNRTTTGLGNFFDYFLKSCTRILLPLSIILGVILLLNGTPMNFEGKETVYALEGDTVQVSRGPAAAVIPIKQLGTNGGGYFGVNSAHPLENPSYLTNMAESSAILLIPVAMVFALGYYLNRRKLAWSVFGVMTAGYLIFLVMNVCFEMNGNPEIDKMGISQTSGSMEGKEIRFGAAASAAWSVNTTVTSNGSVNAMHDSLTPLSGMNTMLGMMINALYGGVGVGLLNYFIFIVIAVFISGLMVGRTPELLGKKIEVREVKIAILIAFLHPFLILTGTALSTYIFIQNPEIGWLNNPSFHGFSEMLYEYTSASANNGSGFEGLGDNTPWWNISTGFVLILARYLPIIGPVAIAGLMASKKYIPEAAGTLQTDTFTFGVMTFAVIFIVAALAFFPALVLGPIAEYFTIY
jgi:potassium-transporting ATPase potassium-binding subunit